MIMLQKVIKNVNQALLSDNTVTVEVDTKFSNEVDYVIDILNHHISDNLKFNNQKEKQYSEFIKANFSLEIEELNLIDRYMWHHIGSKDNMVLSRIRHKILIIFAKHIITKMKEVN